MANNQPKFAVRKIGSLFSNFVANSTADETKYDNGFSEQRGQPAPCYVTNHIFIKTPRCNYIARGTPSKALLDWIFANMVKVAYDRIFFEIIIRNDGSVSLYACYNQILGNALIANLWSTPFKLDLARAKKPQLDAKLAK
jgi:hypothetical protein